MLRVYASAFKAGDSAGLNNGKHVMALRSVQRMFNTIPLTLSGRFDGRYEMSMVFPVESRSDVSNAVNLFCGCLDQQCIMVVDETNLAYMVDGSDMWSCTGKHLVPCATDDLPADFNEDHSFDGEFVWRLQ